MISNIRTELEPHLSKLRVAVYGSGGAPSQHLALLALWGGTPEVIHAGEIVAGGLTEYDAIIFPGGGLAAMAGQLEPLGERGIIALRRWLEAGGSYLGSCAGSCHPLRMSDAYNDAYPDAAPFQVYDVTPLNAAAGAWGLDSPGTGRVRVMPEPHPLFEGLAEPFEIVHYNGPLFPAVPGAAGRVLESTDHFTPFEVSQGVTSGSMVLERTLAQGARVAYHQQVGAGQVTVFGSHPEFGLSPLQLGWLPAVRLLSNALRLVPAGAAPVPPPATGVFSEGLLAQLRQSVAALEPGLVRAASLKGQLPASAPAFLGLSGPDLWDAALLEAQGLLAALEHWLSMCATGETVRGLYLLDCAPKPGQDVGFMGARQLLTRSYEMVLKATDPSAEWPAFTGAYDQLATHPYHLLVSSYLSACGLIAAAALQVTAFTSLNDQPLPYSIPPTSGD